MFHKYKYNKKMLSAIYNNNNSIYNSDILCLCHLTANYIYDYI